ncbi:hypothetical protein DFH06DRAFT_1121003 [Mycena polygramma]|nr:hypothetical protein DFH06DRAFT_1121003 [Mycena polygramma]
MRLPIILFLTLVWPGRSAPLEGGVTNPRALEPPALKVLMQATPPPEQSSATPPPFSPSDLVCTPAQLAYLQHGLANALALASDAATHLSNAEAFESEVVASFLCSASESITQAELTTMVQLRYTNVHQSLSSPLQQVHAIATGDTSVYFQCATIEQQAAAKCGSSYALTGNRGYGDEKGQNIQQHTSITLCPKFFTQPTLDADKKTYLAKQKVAIRGRWTFASPTDSGFEADFCLRSYCTKRSIVSPLCNLQLPMTISGTLTASGLLRSNNAFSPFEAAFGSTNSTQVFQL